MSEEQNTNASAFAKKLKLLLAKANGIPKNGYNAHFRYNFVQEADVSKYVSKYLTEVNLAYMVSFDSVEFLQPPGFNTKNGFLTVVRGKMIFTDPDTGYSAAVNIIGTGADTSDKGLYKAMTGAVKFALIKGLLMPAGMDPEEDQFTNVVLEDGIDAVAKKIVEEPADQAVSGFELGQSVSAHLFDEKADEDGASNIGINYIVGQGLAERKEVVSYFKKYNSLDHGIENKCVLTTAASCFFGSRGSLSVKDCAKFAQKLWDADVPY